MHLKDKGALVCGDFGRDGKGVLDILLGQNGNPSRDATDERQRTVPRGAVGSSDLEIETEEPSSSKSSRARGLVASRLSSPRASRAER